MRKLRLELDDVRVESFPTAADRPKGAGTIFGHAFTVNWYYCERTEYRHCPPTEYNGCTYAYPDECLTFTPDEC